MPVPLLAACSLVAPALAAVRAEKAVLKMIAVESAILVTLDIVPSPTFCFAAGSATVHPIKIDKRQRYSRRGDDWRVAPDNFFIASQ